MTRQKKLKREGRARSRETGESYAAARRQVLAGRRRKSGRATAPIAEPAVARATSPPPRPGDARLIEKTGHGLDHWFAVLDAFGAAKSMGIYINAKPKGGSSVATDNTSPAASSGRARWKR